MLSFEVVQHLDTQKCQHVFGYRESAEGSSIFIFITLKSFTDDIQAHPAYHVQKAELDCDSLWWEV